MIVNLVDVFLHLACQRGRHLAAARFASQMGSIGVELSFKIDQHGTPRGELLVGNGVLKFCVPLIHSGVESGGVEAFSGHRELVDKREFKIPEAFNLCVASGLVESCSATTGDGNCRGVEEQVSNNEILRGI